MNAKTETPREEFNRLTALPLAEQAKPAIKRRIQKLANLPENTGPREEATEKPAAKPEKVRKIRFSQDDLAGWENTHSDNAHADLGADAKIDLSDGWWNFKTQKALDAWASEERETMKGCPICRPEIVANSAHAGSTREGMKINVPLRAEPKAKALTVAEALRLAAGVEAKVYNSKGLTYLTATTGNGQLLKLVWDAQGRYQYGPSVAQSGEKVRKIRNVSEALRLATVAA